MKVYLVTSRNGETNNYEEKNSSELGRIRDFRVPGPGISVKNGQVMKITSLDGVPVFIVGDTEKATIYQKVVEKNERLAEAMVRVYPEFVQMVKNVHGSGHFLLS